MKVRTLLIEPGKTFPGDETELLIGIGLYEPHALHALQYRLQFRQLYIHLGGNSCRRHKLGIGFSKVLKKNSENMDLLFLQRHIYPLFDGFEKYGVFLGHSNFMFIL